MDRNNAQNTQDQKQIPKFQVGDIVKFTGPEFRIEEIKLYPLDEYTRWLTKEIRSRNRFQIYKVDSRNPPYCVLIKHNYNREQGRIIVPYPTLQFPEEHLLLVQNYIPDINQPLEWFELEA